MHARGAFLLKNENTYRCTRKKVNGATSIIMTSGSTIDDDVFDRASVKMHRRVSLVD